MAKNLYNLTEVTTVNNSDLLHVNQGSVSSDKKVTKQNLLKEVNSSISSINNSLTQCLTKTAGYIESGNLNNYVNSGLYLMADKNNITNCPSSWSALLVIGATGGYGCHQLTFASGYGIYYRSLTGSPLAWTAWKHLSGS